MMSIQKDFVMEHIEWLPILNLVEKILAFCGYKQ